MHGEGWGWGKGRGGEQSCAVRQVYHPSLVGWRGRRRLALYWASGDLCTGLYTAAMEGDPAGEGAGVGGGASLRPSRFSPGLPDNRPALSNCPALAGPCPGLLPSPLRRLGEVGREAEPRVRVRGERGFRDV